jgi:hypothetical protein
VATKDQSHSTLTLELSLQSYFYTELQEVNEKLLGPLSKETIFYSSLVMDKFGDANKYFSIEEGRTKNKVLGLKLLESSHLTGEARITMLKDIGDTALLVCGFFSDSLSGKIIDCSYYGEVGQAAYQQLDPLVPSFYDTPSFYKKLSGDFNRLTNVMSLVSQKTLLREQDLSSAYLIMVDKKISA